MRKAILLIAYGAENYRAKSGLALFESACRARFPDISPRWAYSSPLVRERIAKKRQKSDSISKALRKLYFEKNEAVAVQPLQLIPGREYEETLAQISQAREETGMRVEIGAPLMRDEDDADSLASALMKDAPSERTPEEAIVYLGHGARHAKSFLYETLAEKIGEKDKNIYIGALNGKLGIEKIINDLASETVWLIPLFANIGRHALEDMAGDKPDSWLSRLVAAGFSCKPVLKGLAEAENARSIWLDRLSSAASKLRE